MPDAQGDLWDGLRVDAGWFHTLRSMILDGTAGKMGGTAWLVYTVLKCHANLDSGLSFPSRERIADLVDMSLVTVSAATAKLVEMGLVESFQVGRSKRYRLVEKMPLHDKEGAVLATAEATYVPKKFKAMLDEVKAYCQAGVLPGKHISITFNLALVTGEHATVNFNNITVSDKASMAELERRLRLLND